MKAENEEIAIYKIIDKENNVLYIGQTNNIKIRFYTHTKRKPCKNNGSGTFYGRTDISIEVIEYVYNRKEAFKREEELQKQYGLHTDNDNRYAWRLKGDRNPYKEQSELMKKVWSKKSQEEKQKIGKILYEGRKKKLYA